MARKKIREYDSKRLLKAHMLRLKGLKLPLNVAQVPDRLPEQHGLSIMRCPQRLVSFDAYL